MKQLLSTTAVLALAAAVATPASAQVSGGIGVADPAVVIAGSQALSTAYQQITTTFQPQRAQLDQLEQQQEALLKKLDTNNDGRLDEAEQKAAAAPTNATGKQLQTLQQQISTIQQPINLAAAFAVAQIGNQLGAAVQQVVSQGGIQMILPSSAVLYSADAGNLNQKIATALNARLPSVSITPPAGWQPDQQTVQMFQDVQQVRAQAAQAMAAQQQQAKGATPAPAPTQPATKGPAAPVKGR